MAARSDGHNSRPRPPGKFFIDRGPTFFRITGSYFQKGIFVHFFQPLGKFMTSKKMWIVGGVIVAVGAVAYLSYNMPPAGNEAAGTIVEANRAVTDTASTTTATEPTTDNSAAEQAAA